MDGIYLTMAEIEVLSRCSGVAVKAYLRLRARMDIRTGLVGQKSGMSYQALREWTEEAVEKGSGETLLQPSMRNVRTAVEQLVRRGLLVRMRTEKLVFRCALADLAEARPNRTRHEPDMAKQPEPDTEPDTNPTGYSTSIEADYSHTTTHEPDTEPDTNPTGQNSPNPTNIGVGVNPSLPQTTYTAVEGVDAAAVVSSFGLAMVSKSQPDAVPKDRRREVDLVLTARQHGANVTASDPRVMRWAEQGVTPRQMEQACAIARKQREQSGSRQAVNAGYLDAILRDILDPPERKATVAWWADDMTMDAKARELGVALARPGESRDDYKGRIRAAIQQQEAREA